MANKGQRMIFENDYNYLKDLKENHSDPSAEWGGSATPNLFLHNFKMTIITHVTATSVIEATILTKSSTQILTLAELAAQIAELQSTAYNDTVVGVIFGQWYRSANSGAKENILGFGLTGTADDPNLYMVVPNGSGPTTPINFKGTTTLTRTMSWVNQLMEVSGNEVAEDCADVVAPALI